MPTANSVSVAVGESEMMRCGAAAPWAETVDAAIPRASAARAGAKNELHDESSFREGFGVSNT